MRRDTNGRPRQRSCITRIWAGCWSTWWGYAGWRNWWRLHYPELDVDLLLTAAMLHDVGKLDELCYERSVGYTTEGQLLGHIVMELETVAKAMEEIDGFPAKLKTVVQHILISHHGQYEFGSPKLPMIREALVFHYLDDMDSKVAAVRPPWPSNPGKRMVGVQWRAGTQVPETGTIFGGASRMEAPKKEAKKLTAKIHNSRNGRVTSLAAANA